MFFLQNHTNAQRLIFQWLISDDATLVSLSVLQDINKRLSLPADIRLPEGYLEKFAMNSPPFDKPMSRRLRRASLVSNQRVFVPVHICAKPLALIFFVSYLWLLSMQTLSTAGIVENNKNFQTPLCAIQILHHLTHSNMCKQESF